MILIGSFAHNHQESITMARVMRKRTVKQSSAKTARCKALRDQCLTTVATDLELLKANNEGRVPYGAIARLVGEYKESFPWLNKDMVKNHLRKLNKLDSLVGSNTCDDANSGIKLNNYETSTSS